MEPERLFVFCAYAKDMPRYAHQKDGISRGLRGFLWGRMDQPPGPSLDSRRDDDVDNDCDCAPGLQ